METIDTPDIPSFAALSADPEIAPLLAFEPVVRKIMRPDGWTAELQRELIARIAATGTVQRAVWQMGKHATGAEALYKTPTATSFRAAWDAAVAIGRRRNGLDSQPPFMGNIPGINRRKSSPARGGGPLREDGVVEGAPHLPEPLPVICDRCRAEGAAGEEAFSGIPEIFAFDPVPRRAHDKLWDAATQRAFIAALAVSGSPVRAARSVGRHAFGAEKLRKARGSRSFNEAWEAALDLARERELSRLHGTLSDLSEKIDARSDFDEDEIDRREVEEARDRIVARVERLREKQLRDIMDDPAKCAAWDLLHGPEDWAAHRRA
jgi:hypothetical protein